MTVHFIGAGPGAPDLITRARLAADRALPGLPLCRLAGAARRSIAAAPAGARIIDTAALTLDEIIAEMAAAHGAGLDVARVHSGDPSLYGAIAEQMRRLDALGIPYDVTPGVPAFAAAAAALGRELTLPGVAQTVILTRTAVRASAMPEGERLADLGAERRDAGDPPVDRQSGAGRARRCAALRRRIARRSSPIASAGRTRG